MSGLYDPFSSAENFDLEARIRDRALACDIELTSAAVQALAYHARAVLRENERLHLTSIHEPEEFFERHIGESLEGAAMIAPDAEGVYVDLGSGNGYPGLPLAAARPGLQLLLVEASVRKAQFLRSVLRDAPFPDATVIETQIQRASDLDDAGDVRLLSSRAMGGWPKVVPRLYPWLSSSSDVLIWAGEEAEKISQRTVWKRFKIEDKRALPEREASWIWRFSLLGDSA
jgi:16S rRNA (guanine527-N7)-methyltransferase